MRTRVDYIHETFIVSSFHFEPNVDRLLYSGSLFATERQLLSLCTGLKVVGEVKKVGKSRNFHPKVGKSRNFSVFKVGKSRNFISVL